MVSFGFAVCRLALGADQPLPRFARNWNVKSANRPTLAERQPTTSTPKPTSWRVAVAHTCYVECDCRVDDNDVDADNVDVEDDERLLVCLCLRLATFTTHSGPETRSSGICSRWILQNKRERVPQKWNCLKILTRNRWNNNFWLYLIYWIKKSKTNFEFNHANSVHCTIPAVRGSSVRMCVCVREQASACWVSAWRRRLVWFKCCLSKDHSNYSEKEKERERAGTLLPALPCTNINFSIQNLANLQHSPDLVCLFLEQTLRQHRF